MKHNVFGICMATFLTLLTFLCAGRVAIAQEKPNGSDKQAANIEAAKKSYEQLSKALKGQKWDDVKKHMSPSGADEFSLHQASALAMNKGLPPGVEIPGMDEAMEKLESVSKKFGLEKVQELAGNRKKQAREEILLALDKDGKRWEIVAALWDCQNGTPFSFSPLTGKIKEAAVEDGKVILDVDMEASKVEEGGEMHFQMASPPVAIQMEEVNGLWKYSGIDQLKTDKLMKAFMNNMPAMGPAGGEFRMDESKLVEDASFSGETLDGKEISLDDFKGKLLLLDFWGTWCAPCVAELPSLKLVHDAFAKHGFQIVGIAVDEKDNVKALVEEEKVRWPQVIDRHEISDKFRVNAFPTKMLIDKKGKHVAYVHGSGQLINELIERLELNADDFKELKAEIAKAEQKSMDRLMEKMKKKQSKDE